MTDSQSSPFVVNTRRNQRVAARIHVTVTRRGGEDSTLSEDTYTFGGQRTRWFNPFSNRCPTRGIASTSDRDESRGTANSGGSRWQKRQIWNAVAIEFTNPVAHFWQIDFPPADWKPAPG
jgi:hypothetical protein